MEIINKVKSVLLPDTLESRAIRVSQQGDRKESRRANRQNGEENEYK